MRAHYAGGGRGRGLGGKGAQGRGKSGGHMPVASRPHRATQGQPRGQFDDGGAIPGLRTGQFRLPGGLHTLGGALRGELVDTMGGNGSPE